MLTKRERLAQLQMGILSSAPTVRRSGISKASPLVLDLLDDTPETQPIIDAVNPTNDESLSDDPIEEDEIEDEFDFEAEQQFREECNLWISEYAPKMFNLAVSQWLTKQEKKKSRLSATSPAKSSASKEPTRKKSRT